jgi:chromate transporter
MNTPERVKPTYAEIARVFLRVGAFGFGGQMPLVSLIQEAVMEHRHWLTADEFAIGLTIGEILPGPIVVDLVAYVGYRLRGWQGAFVATLTFVLPAFVLMLSLSVLYFQFGELPQLSSAFHGVGATVIALVFAASWRVGSRGIRDYRGVVILGLAMAARLLLNLDVVVVLLLAGVLGLILYRPRRHVDSSRLAVKP